jgi:lipopolysaccharide export LptBFGC system permease protein LptF
MFNLRNFSLTSRTIAWLVLIALILIGLYAFFSSRIGQTALLICCGGIILLVVVGILSEMGMRRPK